MALQNSASDRERLSHIEDATDLGDNKRVQVMQPINLDPNEFIQGTNWLMLAVGNNIQATYPTATTEVYKFRQTTTVIYEITLTFTDSTKEVLTSAERTA